MDIQTQENGKNNLGSSQGLGKSQAYKSIFLDKVDVIQEEIEKQSISSKTSLANSDSLDKLNSSLGQRQSQDTDKQESKNMKIIKKVGFLIEQQQLNRKELTKFKENNLGKSSLKLSSQFPKKRLDLTIEYDLNDQKADQQKIPLMFQNKNESILGQSAQLQQTLSDQLYQSNIMQQQQQQLQINMNLNKTFNSNDSSGVYTEKEENQQQSKNTQTNINESDSNDITYLGNSQNSGENKPNSSNYSGQSSSSLISKQLCIVLELADSSLYDQIRKYKLQNQKFSEKEVYQLLSQMSQTLSAFHNQLNVAHRDIKPQNILILANKFKLCDLGVSKCIESTMYVTYNHTLTGTLNYISPEEKQNYILLLQNSEENQIPYNAYASDVFSLGLVMYEVITLQSVNQLNDSHIKLKQSLDNLMQLKDTYQDNILQSVAKMLTWEPQERITSQELSNIYK